MRILLQAVLALLGVGCVLIGLSHILFGTATIVGGGPVSATIDSELCFGSALLAVYGALALWCARDVEQKGQWVDGLALVFLLGALSRIPSIIRLGQPHWFYQYALVLEFLIPAVLALLNRKVRRAATPVGR